MYINIVGISLQHELMLQKMERSHSYPWHPSSIVLINGIDQKHLFKLSINPMIELCLHEEFLLNICDFLQEIESRLLIKQNLNYSKHNH